MKLLKDKFGTPYFHYPVLPIEAFETSKFLRKLGKFAGLDSEKVDKIINDHKQEYYHYIERFADVFLETRVMSKRFVVVSDSQYTLAVTKFLVNDLGLFPSKQYIIDDAPLKYQDDIKRYFKELNDGIEAEVEFTTDGYKIDEEIKSADFYGYPLIIGSSWEKKIANETKAHYIAISWPVFERLIINSFYVGYDEGLKLLEDIYSVVLTRVN
ncbi:nitrogenase component 1 [Clostridium tyrobutyricum]|uniref:nitrogenase component 1 n=2 Tax=Clostridium tyrobutyricum TaxID=1519 RepID=UPI001FA7EA11|nr:nitrogenase component 1 [Clostridium tyrobutyricum]MEA5009905.1 nitrogenase component 1 [Clostridium tyrobutyricum]